VRGVRTLFVVVLALFGLQHLVLLRAGEPYPALFAPRFSNAREVHDVATEYVRIPIAIDSAGRRLDLRTAGSRIERDPFGLITGNK
jgi:hypothetical protein